jgi:hypothetical protein
MGSLLRRVGMWHGSEIPRPRFDSAPTFGGTLTFSRMEGNS